MDLLYFWSLDLFQHKVDYQANTMSSDTLNQCFRRLNQLSTRTIRSENRSGK